MFQGPRCDNNSLSCEIYLTLENASLMGLRSGLYGGRRYISTPTFPYTVICYFFGVEIFSVRALRPKFCYANIFPTLIFYNYACAYTRACKTRAKEEDEYLPAATVQTRSTKDVHPVLLQAATAIVRARIFINAHSSPPLPRFTRNFFELEIFSDDAARPKI